MSRVQLGRRRAPVRRARRGDEPAGELQGDGDRRPRCASAGPTGVLDICPANAVLPGALRPRRARRRRDLEALAARASRTRSATRTTSTLRHADRRDPRALRRPVDERDADALPRPPPGPGRHRPRVRRADQRLRRSRRSSSTRTRRAPWFASMVGFVAGLPFLYQMVPRERQLEVPKYVRPRTDTPAQTVGHGGCFGCIYSVRGAGGYQMFGITPLPIYDPGQACRTSRTSCASSSRATSSSSSRSTATRYDELQADAAAGEPRSAGDRSRSTAGVPEPTPTPTTRGCWRCSVTIEVVKPGLSTTVQDRGPRGLLQRRHPAVGRAGPVLADRGEPARRQRPRAPRRWSAPTWGRSCAFAEDGRGRRRRRRARAAGGRRGAAAVGRRSPSPAGDVLSFGHLRGGRARVHRRGRRDRRAGDARAAARPTCSARWAASRAARWPRATRCRSATAAAAPPAASVPEALRPAFGTGARDPRRHGPVRPPADRRRAARRSSRPSGR